MRILINSGLVFPVFAKREQLIEKIKDKGHEVSIGGYQTEARDVCKMKGVGMEYIPFARAGLNPISDIKTVISYYKVIKEGRYDLVHSYTAKPNIYGSIAAKIAGVKRIYPTVNGLGYAFTGNTSKNKIVRFVISCLYKVAFSCSTAVFFQNIDDAEEMINRRIVKGDKCVVISGSGIDLKKYTYSEMSDSRTFFMATRLLITKGLRNYFEAARIVKKIHPEARFILAGAFDPNPDGIKKEELDEYVNDGTVEYLGVVENMPEVLKSCSVFVLPSYYREGVPHANLEAMSTGRAIITTNTPGCKETIKKPDEEGKGKNGFLVSPNNSIELSERMIWMLEHSAELREMGKESYEYAKERFDVNIVNSEMMKTMGL